MLGWDGGDSGGCGGTGRCAGGRQSSGDGSNRTADSRGRQNDRFRGSSGSGTVDRPRPAINKSRCWEESEERHDGVSPVLLAQCQWASKTAEGDPQGVDSGDGGGREEAQDGSDRTADSRPVVMLVMLAAFGAGTVGSGRCGGGTGSAADSVRGSVWSGGPRRVRAAGSIGRGCACLAGGGAKLCILKES